MIKEFNVKDFAKYVYDKPINTIVNFCFNNELEGTYGCGIHSLYDGAVFSIGYWGGGLTSVVDILDLFYEDEIISEMEKEIRKLCDCENSNAIYIDDENEFNEEQEIDIQYN